MVERLFYEIYKIKNISHSIEGSKFIKIYKKNDLFFENKLRYVMNKSKKKTACLKNSKLSLSKKVIKQHVLPFRCVGNEYKHALT